MGSIIGIPTTRVSDLFIRQRLMNQVQQDQLDLFRIQMQMSTGRRIQSPSEDANASMRIIKLQRLLERKEQVQTNLSTNQSFLSATDTALSSISSMVAEVRGAALEVLDSMDPDTQRDAVAQQVQQAIRQLLDAGNQQFRGRYLFTGTDTDVRPFELTGNNAIKYLGNEGRLSSYSDIDLLFDTNLHGSEVFGAVSQPVLGTEDVNPTLTFNTRLADLNGGRGVALGSIQISDNDPGGASTVTIDVSNAETIGDVAALIRANPPASKVVEVEISATGLVVELIGSPGDQLSIREVGNGTTAGDLGILTTTPTSLPVVGRDLDPILRLTTRLENTLGSKSYGVVRSPSTDNDLIFTAEANGTALDGTQIIFQNAAAASLTYDPVGGTLTFDVVNGTTTAADVIAMLEADPVAGPLFSASLDSTDDNLANGSGKVAPTAAPITMAGGSGTFLDQTAGLQIVNGGKTHTIDLSSAVTVEDLLNVLNLSEAGLLAEINKNATGIDVRSRINGADFMIGENGGTTAAQLGLRTFTTATWLEDLNFGLGVTDQESGGSTATASKSNGQVATASKSWAGLNNDLIFRARSTGPSFNGFHVHFQDTGPGTEGLTYDRAGKTLTFEIDEGTTDANEIIAMLAAVPDAAADFAVDLNPDDQTPPLEGTGLVWATESVTTAGGDINSPNGGLAFRARNTGLAWNDFTISFEEALPGVDPNFTYDPTAKTMVFEIRSGSTTAEDVRDLFYSDIQAAADFRLEYDTQDEPSNNGSGQVLPGTITTAGGESAGADFSITLADGTELEIDISANDGSGTVVATSVTDPPETSGGSSNSYATATVASSGLDNDLIFRAKNLGVGLNLVKINFQEAAGLPAAVTAYTATELTFQFDPRVSTAADIITALQAHPGASADFEATLDGTDGSVAATVGDMLNLINNHTDNVDPSTGPLVRAQLATYGNGLELVDLTGGTGSLTVTRTLLSTAAIGLGLIGEGQQSASGGNAAAATATVVSTGADNDLTITAVQPGTDMNGVQVVFNAVPGGPIAFGYVGNTLTVDFDPGVSTAQQIINALNDPANPLSATFTAALTTTDNDGSGNVDATGSATMAGGIPNALAAAAVTFAGSNNDILFSAQSTGISLNDTVISFVDTGVASPISFTHDPALKTLQIGFDLAAGVTADAIVTAFRADPLGAPGGIFSASLVASDGTANAGTGFVTATLGPAPAMAGGSQTLTGDDVNPLETEGIFTALLRLQKALENADIQEAGRAIALLDQEVTSMNFSRAELGARQQGLDIMQMRLEDENVNLQTALSEDFDVDLVEVISQFTGRQIAMEASLRTTAALSQMTLLNYL